MKPDNSIDYGSGDVEQTRLISVVRLRFVSIGGSEASSGGTDGIRGGCHKVKLDEPLTGPCRTLDELLFNDGVTY